MRELSLKPPSTYADWAGVLQLLKDRADDEAVLQAMQAGTIAWQSGVAERFTKRLSGALNYRLDQAAAKFHKEIKQAAGQEGAVVAALLALRKELCFLYEAVNLPAIPDQDREQYRQLVSSQADRMQRSLEDSALQDTSGKLASIVRKHPINQLGKDS